MFDGVVAEFSLFWVTQTILMENFSSAWSILATDAAGKGKKTQTLSAWILNGKVNVNDLIKFADEAKDPIKATCIEALEFASKQKPNVVSKKAFDFVTETLDAKAPRVKWESAKVIGNVVSLFPNDLEEPIRLLLKNSTFEGTVVRWSAAFALGEIVKLKTKHNKHLLPAIEKVCAKEEKNSIKKIYMAAIKSLNS